MTSLKYVNTLKKSNYGLYNRNSRPLLNREGGIIGKFLYIRYVKPIHYKRRLVVANAESTTGDIINAFLIILCFSPYVITPQRNVSLRVGITFL